MLVQCPYVFMLKILTLHHKTDQMLELYSQSLPQTVK